MKRKIYEEIERRQIDQEEDWNQFEKELEQTIEIYEMYELFGLDLKEAVKVLKKKDMLEVLDLYLKEFSISNLPEFTDRETLLVVLQMDLETGWGFNPIRPYQRQIQDLKEISKKRPIIPFLAVDPRRDDLYDRFLEAFTDRHAPFFGVKCYPALGYFPSDIRLEPIFKICEEKKIPILAHCGGEIVSTFQKQIRIKLEDGFSDFEIPGKSRKERARFLNEPDRWEPVLKKFKNLVLNFGHFGGDDSWENYSKNRTDRRIEKIIEMMGSENGKVYADFSFNIIEEELFGKLRNLLDSNDLVAARTLFGTDYWVVLPSGELLAMQEKFLKKMGPHRENLLKLNIMNYLLNTNQDSKN